MSMKEKHDNEEFRIVSMDLEAIKGDANKLKLLITSYATIMEVQEAYMQEEINSKEEEARRIEAQIANGNLTEEGLATKKEELVSLTDQIRSMKEVYEQFSEARIRFMSFAHKALKLPEANFKQLAVEGYTIISGEKIELSSLSSSYEEAEKALTTEENKDLFSNINNEDIKQEVERVINEEVYTDDETDKEIPVKDYNIDEVDADKFAENISELADFVKEGIDDTNEEKVDEIGNDLFNESLVASESKEENNVQNIEIAPTTVEIPPISLDTDTTLGEWATSDTVKDGQEQKNIERSYTTIRRAPKPEKLTSADYIEFDEDKSILDYISQLEKDIQEIKNGRERTKEEKEQALQEKTAAEKARDEAKAKSEKTKNEVETLKQYMPRINELKEAKRKEQEALDAEMIELTNINSERIAIETKTEIYNEETNESIEELKKMKAMLQGEVIDEPEEVKTY